MVGTSIFSMVLAVAESPNGLYVVMGAVAFLILLAFFISIRCYRKVAQGQALIRNGIGGTKVTFTGMIVWPIIHRAEYMDIFVKRIAIDRRGETGLICRDNLRADIQVAFFVRVNPMADEVSRVAQSLGCARASDEQALYELFDAKFSEALKSVGKRFDFTELYDNRTKFKQEILNEIGTELNGYLLEDAAIDYLEQTDKQLLNPNNILDAEGIKKITLITAEEFEAANAREREKDKTITQQNVEAQEAILVLNKQLAEAEARQQREVESVQAREEAETLKVKAQELLKSEQARIASEEQIQVASENKERQVIVAARNKERTDRVEAERVQRDQQLEAVERERLVALADLEKQKAVENENKELQTVVRERVVVEKAVVAEEERIKDTREYATADRSKRVEITKAEEAAEQALVKDIKEAEAARRAAEELAQKVLVEAEANEKAAIKNAEATKTLAAAAIKEEAVRGVAEAEVMEAKARAFKLEGEAKATVTSTQGEADARVVEVMADAKEKDGTAEASVMQMKYKAEADGITEKADAMKKFNEAGKEHEEFKLRLNKDLEVELAEISVRKDIATEQSKLVSEGLRNSKIDIVGGENNFFKRLVDSITTGKAIDRTVDNSQLLSDVKETFLSADGEDTAERIKNFISQFGLDTEDVKNLSISALVLKMMNLSNDPEEKSVLSNIINTVKSLGLSDKKVKDLL